MNQPRPKKQMLTTYMENGKRVTRINYSSLDLINACPRKANYILNRSLTDETESEALVFGTAVHKALESWYALPTQHRLLTAQAEKTAKLWEAGNQDGLNEPQEGALEALRQFILAASPLRGNDDSKRSIEVGVKIMRAYFKHYAGDMLEIVTDAKGPMIERTFEFVLHENETDKVIYFGTIDAVLYNKEFGTTFVCDHKTTSALGKEFFNRLRPNHQYTGYIMAANEVLGIKTNQFMVNGIQVAKTKQEFSRQFTERDQEDFEMFKLSVLDAVARWHSYNNAGLFPINAPNPCASYGGCQFIEACSTPAHMRETILANKYGESL
jgi:PD-(D/E)XK nuclease superfamily